MGVNFGFFDFFYKMVFIIRRSLSIGKLIFVYCDWFWKCIKGKKLYVCLRCLLYYYSIKKLKRDNMISYIIIGEEVYDNVIFVELFDIY